MICLDHRHAKSWCCEDISKIENYDKAISDQTQTWVCHHKLEIHEDYINTREDLIMMNLYYNRPACELIFLTKSVHASIHNKSKNGIRSPRYGKKLSKETKRKICEAMKGKEFSKEHKSNISKARTNYYKNNTLHWYNDGKVEVFVSKCPNGFIKGRLNKSILKGWNSRRQS